MAAQYTEVTLDQMETFLKRGFRALRPKQGIKSSEYYYDLHLNENVAIRVWTSIHQSSTSGAGVGADAIRVQLVGIATKRPLMTGAAPIVKRTQGWRNSLQNRIEEATELYEDRHDYWETRGSGTPQPGAEPPTADRPAEATGTGPTDKQVRFLLALTSRVGRDKWMYDFHRRYPSLVYPPTKDDLQKLTGKQASMLIGDLLKNGYGYQKSAGEYSYDRS